MPANQKRQSVTHSNKWSTWRIAMGVASAVTAATVAFLYFKKPELLKTAWEFAKAKSSAGLDTLQSSPHTGHAVGGIVTASAGVVLHKYVTLPTQLGIEAKREGTQLVYGEMNTAFAEGLRYLNPEEYAQPKADKSTQPPQPNYIKAAEAFRNARNLFQAVYDDEEKNGTIDVNKQLFYQKRIRDCYFNEALAFFHLGIFTGNNGQNALENLNELLELDNKDREALNLRGLIYLKQGKFKEALNDLQFSFQQQPGQKDVYVAFLFAKSQLNDDKQEPSAAQCYQLIHTHAEIPAREKAFTTEILYIKAKVCFELKKYAEAIQYLDSAIACTPKLPSFYEEQLRFLRLLESAYTQLGITTAWKEDAKEASAVTPVERVEIKSLLGKPSSILTKADVGKEKEKTAAKITGLDSENKMLKSLPALRVG